MNDAILTPAEKYFKEAKDFSKLLLVLSVAMITVISATYDVKEDIFLDYAFVYFLVVAGQILSIVFGLLLHRDLILLYRAMFAAKEPENFFSQDNPQVKKTVRWIVWQQNLQIIVFLLSMVVFTNIFMKWQIDPMVDDVKRKAKIIREIDKLKRGIEVLHQELNKRDQTK